MTLKEYNLNMIKNVIILVLLAATGYFIFSNRNINSSNNEINFGKSFTNEESTNNKKEVEETNSVTLDLSGQGLEELPSYVVKRTSLEVLNISNNNLTGALPAEIRHLQNLKILNASNNEMTGVPAEVGQLENLEILDLSNNQLTGLPYEMGDLQNLKTLNLSGNNYSKQDLEIIKEDLPESAEIIL